MGSCPEISSSGLSVWDSGTDPAGLYAAIGVTSVQRWTATKRIVGAGRFISSQLVDWNVDRKVWTAINSGQRI
jgi:hypothetical protein